MGMINVISARLSFPIYKEVVKMDRTDVIQFRLTSKEGDDFRALCRKSNLSLSHVLRSEMKRLVLRGILISAEYQNEDTPIYVTRADS